MKFIVTMFRDEGGTFIAECPSISECVGQGKTEGGERITPCAPLGRLAMKARVDHTASWFR
jgi:hypothetical protein